RWLGRYRAPPAFRIVISIRRSAERDLTVAMEPVRKITTRHFQRRGPSASSRVGMTMRVLSDSEEGMAHSSGGHERDGDEMEKFVRRSGAPPAALSRANRRRVPRAERDPAKRDVLSLRFRRGIATDRKST